MSKIYNSAKLLYRIQVALNHVPTSILTNLFRITFKMIRVPLDRLVITTASYENRLAAFKMRIEKVAEYLETHSCRQEFISEYFGMEGTRCGCCDNCLQKR